AAPLDTMDERPGTDSASRPQIPSTREKFTLAASRRPVPGSVPLARGARRLIVESSQIKIDPHPTPCEPRARLGSAPVVSRLPIPRFLPMRKYVSPLFLGWLFIWGCSAEPSTSPGKPSGTGGTTSSNGGSATTGGTTSPTGGSGGSGNTGNTGNTGVTGGTNPGGGSGGMAGSPPATQGGTAGTPPTNGGAPTTGGTPDPGTGGTSTGDSGGGECMTDIENLVNPTGWVCAKDTPIAIQGAW